MDTVFWYFVKNIATGIIRENPIYFETFVGDIGEHIFYEGNEYEILDYAKENVYWSDLITD